MTTAKNKNVRDSFANRKAAIEKLYDGSARVITGKKARTASSVTISREQLDRAFQNLSSPKNAIQISKQLYAANSIYAGIIDYYANMLLWQYYFVPVKRGKNSKTLDKAYGLMQDVVDGLSIETVFPYLVKEIFLKGAVYIATQPDTKSKTLTAITLPPEYCRTIGVSQFGTTLFQFDFSYFKDLGLSQPELETFLESFPPYIQEGYRIYAANRDMNWQDMDGRYCGAILMNEYGFPSFLYSAYSILDYEEYGMNELDKNTDELDKIIIHKIPNYQGELILSIPEVNVLHKKMEASLGSNYKLLTTFGDAQVQNAQSSRTERNEVLMNAYRSIYNNSGINNEFFSSDNTEALKISLDKDLSIVWNLATQIVNFYNLAINNWYNFNGYQCELNILPVTHYNQRDMMQKYKESATLGVGKMEFIIASWTKQSHLTSKLDLEDFLKLDQLKPLSTSYTQVDNSATTEEVIKKEEEQVKEVVEEKEKQDQEEPVVDNTTEEQKEE